MSNDVENPHGNEERISDEIKWLHKVSVFSLVSAYCISASLLTLFIINKLTATMYFTTAAAILFCVSLNLIESDGLDLLMMWRLLPTAVLFNLSQFTSIELLLQANFDTFIVFRSSVPIFVVIAEALYSNKPWRKIIKWVSFITFIAGGVVYMMMTDYQLTLVSCIWGLGYLLTMSIYFVNYKIVCTTMGLNSWGLVMYNNLEALLLCPLELLITEKLTKREMDHRYFFEAILPVGLSCLLGLGICFFGFLFCRGRELISVTGFTVLGIVSKLLTVGVDLVIWGKNSTFFGAVGSFICMTGGVLHMQSVSNKHKSKKKVDTQETEEIKQKLLQMPTS